MKIRRDPVVKQEILRFPPGFIPAHATLSFGKRKKYKTKKSQGDDEPQRKKIKTALIAKEAGKEAAKGTHGAKGAKGTTIVVPPPTRKRKDMDGMSPEQQKQAKKQKKANKKKKKQEDERNRKKEQRDDMERNETIGMAKNANEEDQEKIDKEHRKEKVERTTKDINERIGSDTQETPLMCIKQEILSHDINQSLAARETPEDSDQARNQTLTNVQTSTKEMGKDQTQTKEREQLLEDGHERDEKWSKERQKGPVAAVQTQSQKQSKQGTDPIIIDVEELTSVDDVLNVRFDEDVVVLSSLKPPHSSSSQNGSFSPSNRDGSSSSPFSSFFSSDSNSVSSCAEFVSEEVMDMGERAQGDGTLGKGVLGEGAPRPVCLPTKMYTYSDNMEYKWIAELVYVDDQFCETFVQIGNRKRRGAYITKILGVCKNDGNHIFLTADELPMEHQHYAQIIGKIATSPTKANEIIKRRVEKCSASGWETWRLFETDQAIKHQKKQRCKKTGVIRSVGGGFLNPTVRTEEQAKYYCRTHQLEWHPQLVLPLLTHSELRQFWMQLVDVRGGICDFDQE